MEEPIIFAVQSGSIDDLALLHVARHYAGVGVGWTVSRVEGCHPSFSGEPFQFLGDLAYGKRVQHSTITADLLTIEVDLTRLSRGKSGKRQTRIVRYGTSGIACRLREHPVQVDVYIPEMWSEGKDRRRTPKHAQHLLEEIRSLSDNIDAAWIIVTTFGRGPTLPELLLPSPPSYGDLTTIFFSSKHFNESAVLRMADSDTRFEAWPSGWFLSRSPLFHDSLKTDSSLGDPAWKLLASWGRRRAYLR